MDDSSYYSQRSLSQGEFVRRNLGRDIMIGRLPPDSFLSEVHIAHQYGVSRTPVREAIRSLAADGLVTLRPRKRAVVKGQTTAEILDQFEAMAELEASCARLAARRRTDSELIIMERHQDECRRHAYDDEPYIYYQANVKFHEAIYSASGNRYLREKTLELRDRMWFLRITQGRLPGRLQESAAEHDSVLAAIQARSEEKAASSMRSHLTLQGESLHTMLRHTSDKGVVHVSEMAQTIRHRFGIEGTTVYE